VGYTFVITKRNADILEGLKVELVEQKWRRYRSNWLRDRARMNSNRMPKIIPNYIPNVYWKTFEKTNRWGQTGLSESNWWRMMMMMMMFMS